MPPSSLAGAPPSMDPISAIINLQTLPISNSNINELRSFSTALSEFISCYDELNTHINNINSSIDSKLSPPNRLAEDVTVSVQNQNPSSSENTTFSSSCEEIYAYEKLEDVDVLSNRVEIDVCENDSVEIDALEKPGAAGLPNNRLEVDVYESYVEIDALKKPGDADLSNNRLEIDVSESYVEIDALKKPEDADLSNNRLEIDVSESYVEIDALEKPGDADLSNIRLEVDVYENNYVEIDALEKPEAVGLSNNRLEIDVSESYVEIDALEKPEDADLSNNRLEVDVSENNEIDDLEKPGDADLSNSPLEVDVSENNEIDDLEKPGDADLLNNPLEVDVSESYVEIDALKKPEDADLSNNRLEIDVSESYVEIGALKKPEAAGLSDNRLEVDVSENNYVEVDALVKPQAADLSNNQLEIDALEKPEDADVSNNRLEVDVSENNYVEINVLKKLEGADVFEIPIEMNTLKTPEVANNHVQIDARGRDIDVCENDVEIDRLNSGFLHDYDESGVLKKPEVADVLKDHVGIDSLKKLEVADNDVEIDTLGRDIGVSDNHVEIDSLNSGLSHDYDESNVLRKLEVADVLKHHEEIDEFENRVEIDSLKKPEEIEVCEDPVEIDSLKKLEVANNPVQIDTCGEIDVLENFEEVDVCENHVENDSLNMQEETVPESSCDETMTDVPGAVVSEQNHNRMAAHGKQSNENVRTPECVVEIDMSVHKKHEQAGILKKPEQIDVCKNPKEIVVFKKHEEFHTLMIPEEIAVSKKLEETVPETSCDRTIPIVSEKNRNKLDLGKLESLKEVRKKKKRYRKRRREFIPFSKNPVIFKLQSKCRNMSTKKLKMHVAAHYSEMIDLREEIANALKLAEDPAKLVLRSIGRFFVISSERIRMHAGGSHPLTVERKALVLILECFVMTSSDGIEIARQDREYAAKTAVDWRKRMINEGGLGHTDEVDARGLLLLIGGFGIQDDVFTIQDIMDLIRASNVKGISTALRRSAFLIPKIPEVIYLMVKNNLETEAVDIVSAFGLEDVCHPRNILTTTLHNKIKDIQNASPLQMEETVPESSCDETMADAPGAVVSEQNRNRMAANGKQSNEQTDVLKKPEQIDICKNVEENVVLKKHEEFDTLMIQEEIVVSKKLEETIPETSCDRTKAIVSGKTRKGLALRTPESLEEVSNMKRKQVKDELLHKMKKSRLEKALATSAAIISALEKKKESRGYFDNLMIPEEIGTCKKPEESLPETSCDQTITTVPKAIASEQNPNRMAANVRTLECVEETDVSVSKKPEQIDICKNSEETVVSNKPGQNGTLKKAQGTEYLISVLQFRCQNMNHKKLRRHVSKHYYEMIDLREEISNALKLAKDPARLVLNSISRFFVSGSIAFRPRVSSYKKDENVRRMAEVLILECFVMISNDDGIEIAEIDQDCAATAASDWRKWMIREGGLGHADEVDARGLLLLISGFGIQDDVFTIQDIMDLVRASNVKGIATALRRSVFLIPKIPEVIYLMVKNNLKTEAADIAFTFGLEDVCHPRNILTTNLHNKIKDIQNASPLQMNNENVITPESLEEVGILKKPEETAVLKKPEEVNILKKLISVLTKPEEADTLISEKKGTWKKARETGVVSVLQYLCRRMNYKKMMRYIRKNISELNNLRVDVARALKLAEDPAELVKNSIGRFFERSSKEFRPRAGSHLNNKNVERMAVVLILECFVMISDDGIEITETVWQNAVDAAAVWRNRIIKEGGLRHADEVDARGLLLLISGFGIQDHVFSIQDLIDLIRASNVKGIATALRRSVLLMPKIPEIINKMVHNNLELEAVDIAYAFGLEDTYHPGKILTAYLDNKIKDIQNASPDHMLDAVKQHLLDLKSVKQCLESHNVDPSTLLPDFKINERIQNLEKEVNEWKLIHKRKSKENPPIHHEPKRACVSHQNMPHQHRSPVGHYRPPQLNTSYITAHSASPGNTPGYYAQAVHMANGQPYGWRGPYGQHYPVNGQTYASQPYHRPWEQGQLAQLALFPGILGSRPPSSDLYRFAEYVEKGSRGSRS